MSPVNGEPERFISLIWFVSLFRSSDEMDQKDQTKPDRPNEPDRLDRQAGAVAGMAATRDMVDGIGTFHSEGTRQGGGAYALLL